MKTRFLSKTAPTAGLLLLGGLLGLAIITQAGAVSATQAQAPVAAPPFVYSSGYQGFGYYANPGVQLAPAAPARPVVQPRTSGGAGARSVGPGARNWATGSRVPLHRPWLRSRG